MNYFMFSLLLGCNNLTTGQGSNGELGMVEYYYSDDTDIYI